MNNKKKSNGLSMAAMILGIIGLVFSCIYIGILPCLAGLILSIISIKNRENGKGKAIAGLVTSIIGIIIFMLVLFIQEDDTADNEPIQNIQEENEYDDSDNETSGEHIDATDDNVNNTDDADNTDTITESKEEFIASCQEYSYKTLARNPDDYIGARIVIDVKIEQILQGGLFDNGEYYRVYTNDEYGFWSGDEFFMNDCRVDDDMRLLEGDIIRVYGEFDGMQSVKRALTGTKELVPAINAYYIELLEE